ncbi:MAG: DUF4184 family protein [Verrucomicrobiota bacterium]
MPFTFAHPAIALPFRKRVGAGLFCALAIGTTLPDTGYYIGRKDFAHFGHQWAGLLVLLPWGWAIWWAIQTAGSRLFILASPTHRRFLTALLIGKAPFLGVLAALFIGAWSHVAWDAFTHADGWVVERVPVLQQTVFQIADEPIEVFQLLQHGSTTAGLALMALAYGVGHHRLETRTPGFPLPDRSERKSRRQLWISGLILAGVACLLLQSPRILGLIEEPTFLEFRRLVVQSAIWGTVTLALWAGAVTLWLNVREARSRGV